MKPRILCVDDVPDNLKLLEADLEDADYVVELASSGEAALERVAAAPPDAIVLDVTMPGLSGLEVLERLRVRHDPLALPVIMATARNRSEDVVRALELGANDYVTKPLEIEVLLARLATHLELRRIKRESDELSALRDEFLSIASHDLRGPLATILSTIRLVNHLVPVGAAMTPKAASLLERVDPQCARMQQILEDFLEFQAIEAGIFALDLGAVDLVELVGEVVAGHTERADAKQIAVAVRGGSDIPSARGDRARLLQVLDNLVGNAVKYCGAGARVEVALTGRSGSVRCEVRDEGPGLTDEDLRRAFLRFARLSAKPTGGEKSTGVGLAITKRLVEAMAGEVGVRNNEQRGATFWFELPAA